MRSAVPYPARPRRARGASPPPARLLPVACSLVAVAVAVVLLALPTTAQAGHVLDRFDAPAHPYTEFEQFGRPAVSGTVVGFTIANFEESVDSGIWTIGDPALTLWDAFTGAESIDVSGTVVAFEKFGHVFVTNGGAAVPVRVAAADAIRPSIDGLQVVWQDKRNGTWDIYGANLDPVTLAVLDEFEVCVAGGTQSNPDLKGGWCVWQDRRSGQFDIYARDMAGDSVWKVCGQSDAQDSPSTDGHWVVWTDWRNSGYSADIYGRRLPTGTVRRICHAGEKQWQPVVSDGFVVWTDKRSPRVSHDSDPPPQWSLRGYELSSRDAFRVADAQGAEAYPDMDGHTVVYIHAGETSHSRPMWRYLGGVHLQH